jgi:hypothetical protein
MTDDRRHWRVQVLAGARVVKAWRLRDLTLEEAKNEAERAIARDWPLAEWTLSPI